MCKATRARGGVDRCGGLRRLSFEMCGARGHAYVMITPQQCLAGLFFLAAALALVGFLGLFFAMAHVRLVIPLAIIAKMLRARVTALPNSRAALFYFFLPLFLNGFSQTQKLAQSAHTPIQHGKGKQPVLFVCYNARARKRGSVCIPAADYSLSCTAATSHSRVATSHGCNGNERPWHQER